jgi:threonyl-tRNA synthetase
MELLDQMNGEITVYETGDFIDLCRGPHIPSAKLIKGIKLTKVAGAYWRGDSKREVMTRVYGVTFPSTRDLDEYLKTEAERGKHDHKKIGKELELFETSSLSPGSPFFLPKGAIVYNELLKLAREMDAKYGYQEIITPIMAKSDVWKTSGHYEKYRENMYRVSPFSNEEEEYALKPMNCPFSTVVFKSKTRSYRELPLRFADYGFLHRYELEGTLDGLFRTRLFEQNDAHIFATKDQVEDEIIRVFELMEEVYSLFKFVPIMTLAARPKERIGTEEEWDLGESILKKVLERKGYKYTIKEGDGAFYGPKIDVYVLDFTGRPESAYTVFTVQIDFNLARRFDVKYIGSDNKEHVPIVIHRAVMGSIGRFLGIILENTAGDLPLWLSPTQVAILTVTDKNVEYARKIKEILSKCGLRAELDDSNATLDYKVREKQLKKIPYLAIAGEKEEKAKTIAIRDRKGKVKYGVNPEEFASKCADSISARALDITV